VPISVVSLRRYPVKSMGGESLASVLLDTRGLVGDRWYAVEDADGRFASAKNTHRFRRRDEVLGYSAATVGSGVRVSRGGQSWLVGTPELDAELSAACGAPVQATPEAGVQHQDAGAVSIVGTATLAWCAERWDIDADPRRLRVNIVVSTSEPFEEEDWVGRELAVGSTRLRVVTRVERCRTIDLPQDGASASGKWLRPLADEREMCVAVYAEVVAPGTISLADSVTAGSL
jgi:uncharacterized protein YcbX